MLVTDRTICIGASLCSLIAPDLFDQDPVDGLVVVLREPIDDGDLVVVREAVDSCPSGALAFRVDRPETR